MQTPTLNQKRASIPLRIADHDMEMAESAVRHTPHLDENIGFHCQQAVEKHLKALVAGLSSSFTHDLLRLIELPQNARIASFDSRQVERAAVLAQLAVEWRYDIDDAPSFTSADLLQMAQQFCSRLRSPALAFLA